VPHPSFLRVRFLTLVLRSFPRLVCILPSLSKHTTYSNYLTNSNAFAILFSEFGTVSWCFAQMALRQAVLLTLPESASPTQLPFYKRRPLATPLEATLTRPHGNAHSKRLTRKLSFLESTLTKNRGAGVHPRPLSHQLRLRCLSPPSWLPYLLAFMLINSRGSL